MSIVEDVEDEPVPKATPQVKESAATVLKIAGKNIQMFVVHDKGVSSLRATGPSAKKWNAPTFHELVALIHQTYKGSYDDYVFEV
jgi:hypothetical protein